MIVKGLCSCSENCPGCPDVLIFVRLHTFWAVLQIAIRSIFFQDFYVAFPPFSGGEQSTKCSIVVVLSRTTTSLMFGEKLSTCSTRNGRMNRND